MRRHPLLVLALLLAGLALAAVACGGSATTPAPQPTPMTLNLDTVTKPTDLPAFQSTVELSWQGTYTDGTPASGVLEVAERSVREPRALQVTMYGNVPSLGGLSVTKDNPVELYIVNDQLYTNYQGSWIQMPADSASINTESYASRISNGVMLQLATAHYAGSELYNGVEASHYTFSQADFDAQSLRAGEKLDQVSGNAYLAIDGNYMVHFDVTMTGTNVGTPTGAEGPRMQSGTVKMAADITRLGPPITIQVPDRVLAASLPPNLPLPPDAKDLSYANNLVLFSSAKTSQELADFYKAEMANKGWTQTTDETASSAYRLIYTLDQTTATIRIAATTSDGSTLVRIELSGAR